MEGNEMLPRRMVSTNKATRKYSGKEKRGEQADKSTSDKIESHRDFPGGPVVKISPSCAAGKVV